jgi:hypothetical protein
MREPHLEAVFEKSCQTGVLGGSFAGQLPPKSARSVAWGRLGVPKGQLASPKPKPKRPPKPTALAVIIRHSHVLGVY